MYMYFVFGGVVELGSLDRARFASTAKRGECDMSFAGTVCCLRFGVGMGEHKRANPKERVKRG